MIDAEKLKELHNVHMLSEEEYVVQKKRLAPKAVRSFVQESGKNGIVYILLAFFLGITGIHNLYAGYWGRAVSQLCLSIIAPWFLFIPLVIVSLWVFVEILTVNCSADGRRFAGSQRIIRWLRGATVVVLAIGISYNSLIESVPEFEEIILH